MKFPAKGSLSDAKFIEILKDAASSTLTGMIRLENGPVIKVVYLQKGTISFASSNEKSDRLTEVLKRAGKLTPEQVQDAQTRLKPNVSLGKTLVELGYISAKDLLWGARAQVDSILHQLLFWTHGNYQILEGTLPREIIHLNLPVSSVIFEGIMKSQNRDWILQHIGSPEAIYALSSDFEEQNQSLKLPVSNVISKINGRRSLHEIAQGSGIDTFELCKSVVALEYLDFARPIQDEPLQMALDTQAEEQPAMELSEPETATETDERHIGELLQSPIVEEQPASAPIKTEEPPAPIVDSAEEGTPNHRQQSAMEIPPAPVTGPTASTVTEPEEKIVQQETAEAVMPQQTAQEDMEQLDVSPEKGFNWIALITILLLGVAAGLTAFYFLRKDKRPQEERTATKEEAIGPVEQPAANLPYPEVPVTIDTTEPQTESPQEAADLPTDAPADLLREGKVSAAARSWNDTLSTDKNGYSIQLVIACQEKTVMETHRMLNYSEEMFVLPILYKDQNCYRVLFGQFSSTRQAQAAIQTLPADFRRQRSPASVVALSRVLS